MSYEYRLYDLNRNDWPRENVKSFRSLQVFRCPVCKSLTNNIEVRSGHYHRRDPWPVCPYEKEKWHNDLCGKLHLLLKPHPASYRAELKSEIVSLRVEHAVDDIVGEADLSTEKWFPDHLLVLKPEPLGFSAHWIGIEDE